MIIIAAVDDNLGMMFNNRRVSQDRILRQKIFEITQGSKLWMNSYSWKQFANDDVKNIIVNDSFLSEAISGEYCFVENSSVAQHSKYVEKIILFKWNRNYPSDFSFDLTLSNWILNETCDFAGSSHEKITMEVYSNET